MRDSDWFIMLAAIGTAIIVLVAICMVLASGESARRDCTTYAEITGRQTKYEKHTCFVKYSDGEWYIKGERR